MKKLLVLFLMVCCFSPIYAQKGKVIKGALSGGSALTDAVTRQVAKQTVTVPQVRLAQITNMPGQPTVKLGGAVDNGAATLPARWLSPAQSQRMLFHPREEGLLLYVPTALNTTEAAVYRGLSLQNLDELDNLLQNGLELNKIQGRTEYAIFASNQLRVAMEYALSSSGGEMAVPVLVKIPVTKQCKPLGYNGHYVFINDVPAQYLSDIMVFLEVKGTPGWYKVVRENNEMLFKPVPSKLISEADLATPYFQVSPINLGMD